MEEFEASVDEPVAHDLEQGSMVSVRPDEKVGACKAGKSRLVEVANPPAVLTNRMCCVSMIYAMPIG